ncbi:uncharacterized protein TRIADDRAFT_58466 [Trichoplax adhaerens]|uniref:IPT/TIG domain-containing protein n=1 Tax=Trichoplax adhaerens TaxID=10228 RepID=B3S2S6_TRIAD|nr:hypothetical protein TRIADDRAFT_58466 [Trichoplax adhaerens]EDV22672.1 hypothetical protein TRIADDRAFT_58466 [Trichoplax adhaerens]|eukprot:XP_002114538.1 hypothetical protein TRIADDRAFT_58466 [Trichoplax adhaerens]
MALPQLILCIALLSCSHGATIINNITPTTGSTAGGTRVTIYGEEFSQDQFNYDVPSRGNIVYLSSDRNLLRCDVITYLSNTKKIVCDTRPSPSSEVYKLILFVDGVRISENSGAYCGSQCNYQYSESVSPTITAILPKSGLPGTIITVKGRIFTNSVNSIQELENDATDVKEIVRYGTAMNSETSTEGYIKCKLSTTIIGKYKF